MADERVRDFEPSAFDEDVELPVDLLLGDEALVDTPPGDGIGAADELDGGLRRLS